MAPLERPKTTASSAGVKPVAEMQIQQHGFLLRERLQGLPEERHPLPLEDFPFRPFIRRSGFCLLGFLLLPLRPSNVAAGSSENVVNLPAGDGVEVSPEMAGRLARTAFQELEEGLLSHIHCLIRIPQHAAGQIIEAGEILLVKPGEGLRIALEHPGRDGLL
jgi:hypothetical protein